MIKRNQTSKVSVSIDNVLLEWVDRQCEDMHTNRSRYINRLIVGAMTADFDDVGAKDRKGRSKK